MSRDRHGGDDGNVIDSGAGLDFIIAGTGSDVVHGGDDADSVVGMEGAITDTRAENNILRFGAGVNKDNIKMNLHSLLLNLGNGDAVHIEGFDQNDVFNSSAIHGFDLPVARHCARMNG